MQCVDGRAGGLTRRVGDGQQAGGLVVDGDDHRRAPAGGELSPALGPRAELDPLALHEPAVADDHAPAVNRGDRAVARDVLEAVGIDRGHPLGVGTAHDRLGQRVLGRALDGRRKP